MINYNWESGTRFGRLMCTGKSFLDKNKNRCVECICECGIKKFLRLSNLLSSKTKSCGCFRKEELSKNKTTHGLSGHPLFHVYSDMIKRCTNPKSKDYERYGGRGITICKEWLLSPQSFFDWAMKNGWEEGLTLDRKDNEFGNYEPINCRWATDEIQRRNKRNNAWLIIFGEKKIKADWSIDARCVVLPKTFIARIKYGWDAEKALTTKLLK